MPGFPPGRDRRPRSPEVAYDRTTEDQATGDQAAAHDTDRRAVGNEAKRSQELEDKPQPQCPQEDDRWRCEDARTVRGRAQRGWRLRPMRGVKAARMPAVRSRAATSPHRCPTWPGSVREWIAMITA
jgi:hypothetical protein